MIQRYIQSRVFYFKASMACSEIANVGVWCSGLARTLRTSPLTRSSAAKRAFQPIKKNLAPALAARLASTDALKGKIHTVIGAVVDGKLIQEATTYRRMVA